jgi:hypothetical protein
MPVFEFFRSAGIFCLRACNERGKAPAASVSEDEGKWCEIPHTRQKHEGGGLTHPCVSQRCPQVFALLQRSRYSDRCAALANGVRSGYPRVIDSQKNSCRPVSDETPRTTTFGCHESLREVVAAFRMSNHLFSRLLFVKTAGKPIAFAFASVCTCSWKSIHTSLDQYVDHPSHPVCVTSLRLAVSVFEKCSVLWAEVANSVEVAAGALQA